MTRVRLPFPGSAKAARAGQPVELDSVPILTWYLILLFGIPAPLIFGPLGSAGSPASILGLLGAFLWCWFHAQRTDPYTDNRQPVRTAALVLLLVMLAVYAHAMMRPIDGDEVKSADSGLLKIISLIGVLLLANDGLRSIERFRTAVRRFAVAGGLLGTLALLQFFTGQLFVDRIHIPGLTINGAISQIVSRNGLARAPGTATSPIELSVVLSMTLPLLITVAMHAERRKALYWILTVFVSLAIFLTISRSGLISATVGVLFLAPVWSSRVRRLALVFAGVVFSIVYVAVPGLLGSLTEMFTGISKDSSAASRTDSYAFAFMMVGRSPLLGRGFGTFLPKYRVLDNEYLGFLIEAGVIGLAALLTLTYLALRCARRASWHATSDADRQMLRAVGATVAAGACGAVFFDGFSFPLVAGSLFLAMGLCGAGWELIRKQRASAELATHTAGRVVAA